MAYQVGDKIADYQVTGVLGAGGMGQVYKVRNLISERDEAMKVLLPDLANYPNLEARFLREIKVLASLSHPNIAALRTALRAGNQLIMIMEFVEGQTLADKLKSGPVPLHETIDCMTQVLWALSYAHSQGVIHRDIKPANIMETPGGLAKLMDFGIAKGAADRRLTVTGSVLGSLRYMSPEQVVGDHLDARSDLYSLGASFYEIVTGIPPFQGESDFALMTAHLQNEPPAPIQIDPNLPPALSDLILTALARDPLNRFQTADAFRRAIENIGSGLARRGTEIADTRPPAVMQSRAAPITASAMFGAKSAPAFGVGPGPRSGQNNCSAIDVRPSDPPPQLATAVGFGGAPVRGPAVLQPKSVATPGTGPSPSHASFGSEVFSTPSGPRHPTAAGLRAGAAVPSATLDPRPISTPTRATPTPATNPRPTQTASFGWGMAPAAQVGQDNHRTPAGVLSHAHYGLYVVVTVLAVVVVMVASIAIYRRANPRRASFLSLPSGDMVLVDRGEALIGLGKQAFHIAAFYIDKTEVTNRAFLTFCSKTGHPVPPGAEQAPADSPVVNVSLDDAQAFCRWANKRLPSASEWEKAARGARGQLFPWGDVFDYDLANVPRDSNAAKSARLGARGSVPIRREPLRCSKYAGQRA